MRLKFLKTFLTALIFTAAFNGQTFAIDNNSPLMLKDDNYTEYWEQYFYLNDGSLVTSQFLVANFPWPVGDDHGIMLGTLVTPEGKQYVIKNGRDLGKWGYDTNNLDIFIHTHTLKKTENGYSLHLENTMGVVDLTLQSHQGPFNHKKYSSEDGTIETSFYAPYLTGFGNWQLGQEAGFNPAGPVHNAESLTGFGVHVVMTDKVDKFIKNWARVISVNDEGPKLFISAINRPDGSEDFILKLLDKNNIIDSFSNIKINYLNMTKEKDGNYPKAIEISASGDKGTIAGTIQLTQKITYFNLNDHLNFFEKSFAKSNPSVSNFRYLADYNLVYKTNEEEKSLIGKALTEYVDIMPPKKISTPRRRNRR